MPLSKDFVFSANNLQDYLDCPRRFELKYILKQSWPAITSQPIQEMEYKIHMGNRFHKIVHQFLSGIPAIVLENSLEDPELINWFTKFQIFIKTYLDFPYFSEHTITMPFEGMRLIAVFDFITFNGDKQIIIGDWKTTTRIPKSYLYLQSIQSLLYPFMAIEVRGHIFPQADILLQEDLSMVYWFPAFPEKTIALEYSKAKYSKSQKVLSSLISEIAEKEHGTFKKTINEKRCAFCQYRSLCERGIQAGILEDTENDPVDNSGIVNIDFDQVEEIAF